MEAAKNSVLDQKATILQIQRMSTEDGPGIRTTVFFKGCSLNCLWCQNPESISMKPEIQWMGTRCIGCLTCVHVCPKGALSAGDAGIVIDRTLCDRCGLCTEKCPSTAMDLIGREWSLGDLADEVQKDRVYFEKSGGGITLSGGEPAMQGQFAADFLAEMHRRGIHTALDTCGHCSRSTLEILLPHTDLVLYDIKDIDPERHRRFTGSSNERILENSIFVARHMEERGRPGSLWIRTPVIPDATAREENIRGIGRFIADNLHPAVQRWELCSFNTLCRDKYVRLNREWFFRDHDSLTEEFMERIAAVARDSGIDPALVHWSGPTKFESAPEPEGEAEPASKKVEKRIGMET